MFKDGHFKRSFLHIIANELLVSINHAVLWRVVSLMLPFVKSCNGDLAANIIAYAVLSFAVQTPFSFPQSLLKGTLRE